MNHRLITDAEIAERQLQVRRDAYRARHAFNIAGVRQLVGNTFIALGTRVVGKCESTTPIVRIPAASRTASA